MGYYTDFTLSATREQLEALEQISEHKFNCDGTLCGAKWYAWKKDMLALSLQYPGVVFQLEGKGEEQEDFWCAYFKDGKSQQCMAKITFDPYDPEKML